MRRWSGDKIAATLVLAFAAAMAVATLGFPPPGQPDDPGTAAFPRMVAAALGALALAQLLRPGKVEQLPRGGAALRVGGIMALLLLYTAVFETLGFLVSTALFLLAALLLAGVRRILYLALASAGVSLALFYVFYELLEVSLPTGFLEGLLF